MTRMKKIGLDEKNILIFMSSLHAGGAEKVICSLANKFVEKGSKVTIITIQNISSDFYPVGKKIIRLCIEHHVHDYNVAQRVINFLGRIYKLRKLILEINPDLAISMVDKTNLTLLVSMIGIKNVRKIVSERTYPAASDIGAFWYFSRRWIYGWADLIVAQTKTSEYWLRENTSGKNIIVIPNSINFPLEVKNPVRLINAFKKRNKKILLTVGRLVKEKGFDRLISIYANVANEFPDWDLAIIGEGNERNHLKSLVSAYGLSDRIFMPGIFGNIGECYEVADIFILTSYNEGFPNVLLEAMAYGLPTISFDCMTGPRDIISNGINGILIENNDIEGMVINLKFLMTDEPKRKQLGLAAKNVVKLYSDEAIFNLWQEALFPFEG